MSEAPPTARHSTAHASRRLAVVGLLLTSSISQGAHAEDTIEPYLSREGGGALFDLTITGDGYTSQEAGRFRADAVSVVSLFFTTPPFDRYRDFYNVTFYFAESAESGVDHPDQAVFRDTRYDTRFDTMRTFSVPLANETMVFEEVLAAIPETDAILLLVNDPDGGGTASMIAVASNGSGLPRVAVHELGHLLGGLGDEYEIPGYSETVQEWGNPNIETDFHRDSLRWSHWVDPQTPLPTPPTPSASRLLPLGAYEGGHYLESGYYRPAPDCMMRDHDRFCAVCQEALVLSLHRRVDLVAEILPPETSFRLRDPTTFGVRPVPAGIGEAPYAVEWFLDGQLVAENERRFKLVPGAKGVRAGAHELTVVVTDPTPWVRDDPDGVMVSSRTWSLFVPNATVRACNCTGSGGPHSSTALLLFGLSLAMFPLFRRRSSRSQAL